MKTWDEPLKQWHFFDKVYRIWVELLISTDEEFIAELESIGYKYYEDVEPAKAKGMLVRVYPQDTTTKSNMTIIWMRKYELATLVHEIAHLVIQTFHDKHIDINQDNTEVFAFYMEYWTHEMLRVRKAYPNSRPPKLANK